MPNGESAPSPDRGAVTAGAGPEPGRRWRAPEPDDLLWLDSEDGEAVVFDRRSTQTHLLNIHAAIALRTLLEGPTDAAGLAENLAQAAGLETAASRELATEILKVFDKLGLVEPAGL